MSAGRTISRRKLAAFIADELQSGHDAKGAIKRAAAYLVETGTTRSASLLVRDIEEALADNGVVIADVATAHPLDKDGKAIVAELFPAKELHIRETVEPSVLGGIRVEVSGRRYDGTLKHKIDLLKEINTKEGTS